MRVIAFAYDADYHCIPCTTKRFGEEEGDAEMIPEGARDGEGNPVTAVFDTDEWYANEMFEGQNHAMLGCGTCGDVIDVIHSV